MAASAPSSFLFPPLSAPCSSSIRYPTHRPAAFSFAAFPNSRPCQGQRKRRGGGGGDCLRPRAQGSVDLLGDLGARDPFPEEIASNFGEKVLGNNDTLHRILIPNISALSLSEMECEPLSPSQPPISPDDADKLLKKVVGWRTVDGDGGIRLQCLWKLRDYKSGIELIHRIYQVVETAGHYPSLYLEVPNQVRVELWSSSIGGLSMNDFIVAAKIDQIKIVDLLPKKRIWA